MPALPAGALLPSLIIVLVMAVAAAIVLSFVDSRLGRREKPQTRARTTEAPQGYRKAA